MKGEANIREDILDIVGFITWVVGTPGRQLFTFQKISNYQGTSMTIHQLKLLAH